MGNRIEIKRDSKKYFDIAPRYIPAEEDDVLICDNYRITTSKNSQYEIYDTSNGFTEYFDNWDEVMEYINFDFYCENSHLN